ncbi:DUF445 domain-containing protein [Paenibacillus sp.]|uniref:DUF445 domain-containing protein n=1 Tax=Paenibacillus sp. TaxID=58172 RepID=UPI0028115A28|nr:DUF445 domain-containing protein [Paenibacillus sp.]
MKKNAKHTAAISLGIMGAGFAAAFPIAHLPYGFVLQSGFEAGLVGGLADWFAVTALFRHPLGIPIPHTALLPKNRGKVTNALVNAIQTNLLHKQSILEKMKEARIAHRLADRAKRELEADDIGERAAKLLGGAIRALPRERVAEALAGALRDAVRGMDARAMLERIGSAAADRGYEEPLLDYALSLGERFAIGEEMRRRMGAMALRSIEQMQLGGFMGFAVNAFAGFMNEDKLGGMLQDFLVSFLYDMRRSGNPYRESALDALRGAMRGLTDNERVLEEAERLKARIAEGGEWDGTIAELVGSVLNAAERRLSDPAFCREKVAPYAREALARLEETDWIARADGWIQHQAAAFVEKNHGVIGQLVKENADKLDDDTLIAMMEEHVGKDLQWIRVNGAVCGFAIGLVLGLVQWFAVGG